jgi:hypothetical protein
MKNNISNGSNNLIIGIGLSGFPFSLAPAQKLLLIAKAAKMSGYDFLVISNSFIKENPLNSGLRKKGSIDGIIYCTTAPSVFSPDSFFSKLIYKLKGKINELLLINKYRKRKRIGGLVLYSKSSLYCLFWSAYAKIFGIKVSLIYFELLSSLQFKRSFPQRLNFAFFDNYIFKYFDGVITISDGLIFHIEQRYPEKKIIKIPPLVDFKSFAAVPKKSGPVSYFLYCGTLFYLEVVEFIIESYARLSCPNKPKLTMVLNGDPHVLKNLHLKIVGKGLENDVTILSNLKYEELVELYVNAIALLIPLRDTPQDTVRFPQKIAEYCAAQKPIITTRIGEVVNYFDNSSMIFSDRYDIGEFSDKMKFVIENRDSSDNIASACYRIGKLNFDYQSFSEPLSKYFSNL